MSLNRKQAPAYKQPKSVKYNKPRKHQLKNGIPVFSMQSGTQDVLKIDIYFNAGLKYQKQKLIAGTMADMLQEGSKNYKADKIVELFDFYGAHVKTSTEYQYSKTTLFTLKKYADKTLPVLQDIIINPTFPENELEILKKKKAHKINIQKQKVTSLSRELLLNCLYGNNHIYGQMHEEEDVSKITSKQLFDHHNRLYSADNCFIIVTGNIDSKTVDTLNNYFGDGMNPTKIMGNTSNVIETKTPGLYFKEKSDSVQSGVRAGKILFNKTHPDYIGLSIVNKILGGYFGSRLMANIREDKGYTYGIGSGIINLPDSGYFTISSEVGSDVAENTVAEIKYELKKLRTEIIHEDELNLVKNYMLGEMLNEFDGPFAASEIFKAVYEYNLDFNFYDQYIQKVKEITPKEVQMLAEKYLNEESVIFAIAGKTF